jgi:hypothetical protein
MKGFPDFCNNILHSLTTYYSLQRFVIKDKKLCVFLSGEEINEVRLTFSHMSVITHII